MIKTYTEDEVELLKKDWQADLFEQKTLESFKEINRRLTESNNYKATIGRDVKSALGRLDALENRFAAEDADIAKKNMKRQQQKQWYQDWVIRIGIMGTIVWEILNIWQAAGGSVHGIVK